MGRELRMVPPNWDHPRDKRGAFRSMYDKTFASAVAEWKAEEEAWNRGERPDWCCEESKSLSYREWAGDPPDDPSMYRPWQDSEATWYQVWETVSEGTPVTPPFATREELVEYLVAHGDFWDQDRRKQGTDIHCAPWSRDAATKFVFGDGWAPSMVLTGGQVMSGVEFIGKQ